MKSFSEFCKKLTNRTRLFLGLSFLLLALIFFVSACFHVLSERLTGCFALAEYADALLRCLRPCCAVLGLGAIALQRLDSKEKEE